MALILISRQYTCSSRVYSGGSVGNKPGWGGLAAEVRSQHFPEDPGLGPGYHVSKSSCDFGIDGYARSIPSILDLGESPGSPRYLPGVAPTTLPMTKHIRSTSSAALCTSHLVSRIWHPKSLGKFCQYDISPIYTKKFQGTRSFTDSS